jgi:hypothetical protein
VASDGSAVTQAANLVQAANAALDSETTKEHKQYETLVAAAQKQGQAEIAAFDAQNPQDTGFLIHLQALDQLTSGSTDLAVARWALFALFVLFEILPVLTKTLQSLGPNSAYENGFEVADKKRLKAFEDALDKGREQVVGDLAAAHVRATRDAIRQADGSTSSRRDRKRLRTARRTTWGSFPGGSRSTQASQTSPHPGGAQMMRKILQQYQPPQASAPNDNGSGAGQSAGPGTP